MKDGCSQRGIGFAFVEHAKEVFGFPCAARSDHRNLARLARLSRVRLAIEAGLHAVRVHGSQQDLTGSELLAALRPLDRIDAFIDAAALWCRHSTRSRSAAARVDGEHDGLRAELVAEFSDQFGPANGGGVDADLVGAGHENAARIGDRSGCRRQRSAG